MTKMTKMINKVIKYSEESFYRMNASTATGYSFSFYINGAGRLDFQGGYVWGENFDGEDYRYDFETKLIHIAKDKTLTNF